MLLVVIRFDYESKEEKSDCIYYLYISVIDGGGQDARVSRRVTAVWVSEASYSLGQNGCVAKTSHASFREPGSRVRERGMQVEEVTA